MSALPPIATAKADMPQMVMSALPPKAEMCGATGDVRFGPKADIAYASINRAIRAKKGEWGNGEAQRTGSS
jgi:hypothetical protein